MKGRNVQKGFHRPVHRSVGRLMEQAGHVQKSFQLEFTMKSLNITQELSMQSLMTRATILWRHQRSLMPLTKTPLLISTP